ncbi:LLM class flavin-dependent oxidoreductase [Streptomyces sp. NPDC013157]|uniref:LLM class flavin-dependent oxidoreductase n=1 Tax=Streptomyces sp. NPDC013157 TaxID=3364861 RepID=UPI0036BA8DAA
MEELTWESPEITDGIAAIRSASPFVYGLTNYVAANLSANVLLAVGAGPAIGAAADFPTVFPAGAGGVWINTAALIGNPAEPLVDAARTAHAAGTPWVLDPVAAGAGATEYDAFVKALLDHRPTVIRGNASELVALAGRDFAARWADVVFCSHESLESAVAFYADVKARAAARGRDPDQLKILPAATTVVGTDLRDALAKHEAFTELVHPEAGLSRLAYHVDVDLTRYDLDGPLPALDEVGVEGHYREVVEFAEREKLSVREIGRWYGARTEGNMIGSASDIADTMELWLDSGAADGFMIQATHVPTAFEEFAAHVVPELRRRGLVRTDYAGATLRENLGLARPERGEWRNRAASTATPPAGERP